MASWDYQHIFHGWWLINPNHLALEITISGEIQVIILV